MVGTPSYSGGLIVNQRETMSVLLEQGEILELNSERKIKQFLDGQISDGDEGLATAMLALPAFPFLSVFSAFEFDNNFLNSSSDYSAFGAVLFPNLAADDDEYIRKEKICKSFLSALPADKNSQILSSAPAPRMITVWPLNYEKSGNKSDNGASDGNNVCRAAIKFYNLDYSLKLLRIAEEKGRSTDDRGPFLLAWSPGDKLGQPKTHILMADMSYVDETSEMTEFFRRWRVDIESNPEDWADRSPSKLEQFRLSLKRWADDFGPKALSFLSGT